MPRRANEIPTDSMQVRFRDQVIALMEQRGWNDGSLAKRASEYYPVSSGTIWKIRNSDPPRRIDIDEASAIARAFELSSIEDMLTPPWAKDRLALLERVGHGADQIVSQALQIRNDVEAVPPSHRWGDGGIPPDRLDLRLGRKVIMRAGDMAAEVDGSRSIANRIALTDETCWRNFAFRLAQDPDSRDRVIASITRQREALVTVAEEVRTRLGEAIDGLDYQMEKVTGENGDPARMWRTLVTKYPALAEFQKEAPDVQ